MELPCHSAVSLLVVYSREIQRVQAEAPAWVFISSLFMIAPSDEEQLKKTWYIQGRECCLAVQRNQVLMCVHESWKILSLRNESQKAAHEMIPFILNALTHSFIVMVMGSRSVLPRDCWGVGSVCWCVQGFFLGWWKYFKVYCVYDHTTLKVPEAIELYT